VRTVSIETRPIVGAAVAALDSFGAPDRATAARLLSMWAREAELTLDEAAAVVAHFPATAANGRADR
jgi:hypothetical protein